MKRAMVYVSWELLQVAQIFAGLLQNRSAC